jgi:hypothetical protein
MKELRPGSLGDTSEFERQLLAAARGDQIPPALKQHMAGALGAPLAANTSPPPAGLGTSAGAHAGGLLFSKTGLWGVLTLALLAGASSFYALRATNDLAVAEGAPTPSAPAPPPNLTPIQPNTLASASGAASKVAPLADARLRAEIALLDRARQALRSGAPARAAELLAQHERRFAPAALAPEADALHIETLLQRGERSDAEQRARHFFSAYPAHPLSDRIQRLLAAAGTQR